MLLWRSTVRSDLQIEDIPEGLCFRLRPERKPLAIVWNYIYPTYAVYLLAGLLPPMPAPLHTALVLVCGGALGAALSRPRTIAVTFTRDGVRVRGTFGAGYRVPRWIPLNDIADLRWQPENNGGPETVYEPAGLYARRGLQNVCLLPYLTPSQTASALQAIGAKFSWMDRTPGSSDSLLFTDDLVHLHLDD